MLLIVLVFLIIVSSMVLHEIAHGFVAYWLGDETAKEDGRLSLNPFVHLEWFSSVVLPFMLFLLKMPIIGGAKPVPVDRERLKWGPYGMALVALAGPMMNFLIAIFSAWVGFGFGLAGQSFILMQLFKNIVLINLGFMVFNLLPIPPLDGSRVIYALAPDGVRKWLDILEGYGIMAVVFMMMIFSGPLGEYMAFAIDKILSFIFWLVG